MEYYILLFFCIVIWFLDMAHVNFTGMWQDTRLCSEGILCVAELQHTAPHPPFSHEFLNTDGSVA